VSPRPVLYRARAKEALLLARIARRLGAPSGEVVAYLERAAEMRRAWWAGEVRRGAPGSWPPQGLAETGPGC